MIYTDKQMRKIEADPIRLRGYFWRVATNARQMAAVRRNEARRGFLPEESALRPDTLERFADSVMENIDVLVSSTLRRI